MNNGNLDEICRERDILCMWAEDKPAPSDNLDSRKTRGWAVEKQGEIQDNCRGQIQSSWPCSSGERGQHIILCNSPNISWIPVACEGCYPDIRASCQSSRRQGETKAKEQEKHSVSFPDQRFCQPSSYRKHTFTCEQHYTESSTRYKSLNKAKSSRKLNSNSSAIQIPTISWGFETTFFQTRRDFWRSSCLWPFKWDTNVKNQVFENVFCFLLRSYENESYIWRLKEAAMQNKAWQYYHLKCDAIFLPDLSCSLTSPPGFLLQAKPGPDSDNWTVNGTCREIKAP